MLTSAQYVEENGKAEPTTRSANQNQRCMRNGEKKACIMCTKEIEMEEAFCLTKDEIDQ